MIGCGSRLGAKHHLDQLLHSIRQPLVALVPGWGIDDGDSFKVSNVINDCKL